MSLVRANVIALMRGAFRRGQSAGSFIRDMREKGLTYRRTDMLSDWRSVSHLERKAGMFESVRRDYYPSKAVIASVTWKLPKEYMYIVRVQSRLHPELPTQERKVNIVSDTPMTPAMVEQAITEKWVDWEDYTAEAIEKIIMFEAVHRVAK